MRIKAFTLMELLIVIILIGILLSFAVSGFMPKKHFSSDTDRTVLPQFFISTAHKIDGFYYIAGDKCDKSIIVSKDKTEITKNNSFDKKFKVYFRKITGILGKVNFDDMVYKGKKYHVCLKLKIKKGRFSDKFIVETFNKFLLFDPFFQDIKIFSNFKKAKNTYFQKSLIPKSIDEYYQR
jgi:prepilin-type N-terminal cleavage/methylation domain-containing protein